MSLLSSPTPLDFVQGDSPTLTLVCTDDQGNPVNLTGASLSTQIQGPNGEGPQVFPNTQHTLANQTTSPGQFALALSSANTLACAEGSGMYVYTTATLGGVVTTYRGVGILTVYNQVPPQ